MFPKHECDTVEIVSIVKIDALIKFCLLLNNNEYNFKQYRMNNNGINMYSTMQISIITMILIIIIVI